MENRKIVRSKNAGVFFGNVDSIDGTTVTMSNARRLWYWEGAASLSQMAMEGVAKPKNCKFTVTVDEIIIFEVCEVITVTEAAGKSIDGVAVWKV
jgi:hypothetical protein